MNIDIITEPDEKFTLTVNGQVIGGLVPQSAMIPLSPMPTTPPAKIESVEIPERILIELPHNDFEGVHIIKGFRKIATGWKKVMTELIRDYLGRDQWTYDDDMQGVKDAELIGQNANLIPDYYEERGYTKE